MQKEIAKLEQALKEVITTEEREAISQKLGILIHGEHDPKLVEKNEPVESSNYEGITNYGSGFDMGGNVDLFVYNRV